MEEIAEDLNPYDWDMAEPTIPSYEIRDLKRAVERLTISFDNAAGKNEAKFVQKVELNSLVDDRIKESPIIEGLSKAVESLTEASMWMRRACVASILSLACSLILFFLTIRFR
jgi:hypothetical protein